jgi:hypothetical protein
MGHFNHQSQGNQSATSLVNYVWRQEDKSVKKNYMDTKKNNYRNPELDSFLIITAKCYDKGIMTKLSI